MEELDRLAFQTWVFMWVLTLGTIAFIWVAETLVVLRDKTMIRAVQNMELWDGVTFCQGTRAYFREEGYWFANREWVYLFVSGVTFEFPIRHVKEKKGWQEAHIKFSESDWMDEAERIGMLECMYEAAIHEKSGGAWAPPFFRSNPLSGRPPPAQNWADHSSSARATVTPLRAVLGTTSRRAPIMAARSHTLSTPVTRSTRSDGVKSPSSAASSWAL